MRLAEAEILALADGRLAPSEAERVEHSIWTDPEAEQLLDLLAQTDLPYRQAVETLVEVPDLSPIVARIHTVARPEPAERPRSWTALVVALVLGAIAGAMGTYVLIGQPEPAEPPTWVDRLASFHAMMASDTVEVPEPDAKARTRLTWRFSDALGFPIDIPDLAARGLAFRTGQILTLDDRPLISLVYLADDGDPVALGVRRNLSGVTMDPTSTQPFGLTAVAWADPELAWVVIGRRPGDDLAALANTLGRPAAP